MEDGMMDAAFGTAAMVTSSLHTRRRRKAHLSRSPSGAGSGSDYASGDNQDDDSDDDDDVNDDDDDDDEDEEGLRKSAAPIKVAKAKTAEEAEAAAAGKKRVTNNSAKAFSKAAAKADLTLRPPSAHVLSALPPNLTLGALLADAGLQSWRKDFEDYGVETVRRRKAGL
jgi:hypothetical protein